MGNGASMSPREDDGIRYKASSSLSSYQQPSGAAADKEGAWLKKTLKLVGMKKCNPASVLGNTTAPTSLEFEEEHIELAPDEAILFRQVVGKATFYCRNRVDM